MDSREMFADGRVQLQVIGGQLRRLPRRIETIGSQLERNVRAEHKDVPRPPGTRMDRFVGRELTTTLVGVALIVAAVLLSVSGGGPQLAPTSHSYRS